MEHNLTLKTYMAIMAERDAAIQERNMALDERRRAFAERDMAMLERDAAIAERNSAMDERDKALAALQYRESSMNEDNMPPDSPGTGTVHEAKHLYHQQHHQMPSMPDQSAETGYDPREIPTTNSFPSTGVTCETSKPTKAKQAKETGGSSTKKSRSPRKGKRGPESSSQVTVAISNGWNFEQDLGVDEEDDPDGQLVMWKDNRGLNQISFDESTMPVPVCSCTGAPQPCYKWGNGGWQSACCTTTVSMYPLPQTSNKRHARVGGRKMSGSVFTKLLNRLAAEGYDLYSPLDLKDHWAKHGTNRYSTLK